jgi:hypothetical protein
MPNLRENCIGLYLMYTTSKLLHAEKGGQRKTKELETKAIFYCVSIPNLQSLRRQPLKMRSYAGAIPLFSHHK